MAVKDQKNESVNEEQRRSNDLARQAEADATTEKPAEEKVEATEHSRDELVNDIVDQTTGEVKKGQPGGGSDEGVSDRPQLSEQDARRVNGYAGFENIAEQQKADPRFAEAGDDTLYEKK